MLVELAGKLLFAVVTVLLLLLCARCLSHDDVVVLVGWFLLHCVVWFMFVFGLFGGLFVLLVFMFVVVLLFASVFVSLLVYQSV